MNLIRSYHIIDTHTHTHQSTLRQLEVHVSLEKGNLYSAYVS